MIVALGAFDGFHKAHRQLLEVAEEEAQYEGIEWGIVTFENHPQTFLAQDAFLYLFSSYERNVLERYWGIPNVYRFPFSDALSTMSPKEFIDYLAEKIHIDGIVVGNDFRFGENRVGNPEFLHRVCKENNWSLKVLSLIEEGGHVISSSFIRDNIRLCRIKEAWELLGHPYFCHGTVVEGQRRGRKLGFPTANISVEKGKISPGNGVYATLVATADGWHIGAANIGHNPTFGALSELRFEVHLIDFSSDLYGQTITVFFLDYIRGERAFSDAESLRKHMVEDILKIGETGNYWFKHNRSQWDHFYQLLYPSCLQTCQEK